MCGVLMKSARSTCSALCLCTPNRTGSRQNDTASKETLHRPYRRQRCSGAQSRRSCATPSKTVGRKSNGLSQERGHSYPCDPAFDGCRWHRLSFARLRERCGRHRPRSPHCRRQGYWRARHAACSGAHACEGRTTNTELGGRALRQPTKKPAGRAFRWAVGGASSKFLARHGCAPADAVELAPLVQLDLCIVDVPPLRLCDRLQVLRLHVAVLV